MEVIFLMGNITESKKQISITLDRDILAKVKQDSKAQMRNVSTQIAYILDKYYNKKDL